MAKEMCEDCGKVFEAGPYTFLCPDCRRKRMINGHKRKRDRSENRRDNDEHSV